MTIKAPTSDPRWSMTLWRRSENDWYVRGVLLSGGSKTEIYGQSATGPTIAAAQKNAVHAWNRTFRNPRRNVGLDFLSAVGLGLVLAHIVMGVFG